MHSLISSSDRKVWFLEFSVQREPEEERGWWISVTLFTSTEGRIQYSCSAVGTAVPAGQTCQRPSGCQDWWMSWMTVNMTHFPSEDKLSCEVSVTISSETEAPWYEKKCLCVFTCVHVCRYKGMHVCVSDYTHPWERSGSGEQLSHSTKEPCAEARDQSQWSWAREEL